MQVLVYYKNNVDDVIDNVISIKKAGNSVGGITVTTITFMNERGNIETMRVDLDAYTELKVR